jgi:diaminopimelate epimerase
MHFVKYQGTGNDFILIDNRELVYFEERNYDEFDVIIRKYDNIDVKTLCHPKFGIGADGLMLLQDVEGYDFEMVYYNSDGNISTMCGNGGRCIVAFAGELGILKSEKVNFLAIDGPHEALYLPNFSKEKATISVELQLKNVNKILKVGNDFVLDTGSPHYVQFVENIDEIDIIKKAHLIRYGERYRAEGINVNFVEIIDAETIKVRTYERGVENETLSCGTGVTASSISFLSKLKNLTTGIYTVNVNTPGGALQVRFFYSNLDNEFQNVTLIGPAVKVFEGEIGVI